MLFVVLFVLWLLMSGIYKPLVVGLGVISCLLCVWIVSRLEILGEKGFQHDVRITKLVRYVLWLTVEIGKADWAIAKVILSPDLPRRQRLIAVPCTQQSDFGKMLFANSITITPGTVTVETEPGHFIVHALTDEAADPDALADMGTRVRETEAGTS